ncbi:DUF1080 domain-containing protein [Desulfopila sp. IMCC35006]|uniref:beta strand repeat-containing protein n=1 Tax=Desulfopila sp. IMCC35006 TaxID=2569542 RepID=UPI0010AC9957|nr:IPT/TIG domain-containing protein [Desulfopila sp. IMCC35006]TKB23975.1 DUF1080 domain-containing protein [Desulfopila sp. IMCC35006]
MLIFNKNISYTLQHYLLNSNYNWKEKRRKPLIRTVKLAFLIICCLSSIVLFPVIRTAESSILTVAVLIDSTNVNGYNPDPLNPGEFQRYPERYLEHLQVPYEIIDISATAPPTDLADRHLILVGHKNVFLSTAWQNAIASAVAAGSGLVNLDWDQSIGAKPYIQEIFGSNGSFVGTPASSITVPLSVTPNGTNPHYIAGLQQKFMGDPAGDIVYSFHEDANRLIQTSAATVLNGGPGTVIAYLGSDPLITATHYGQGRAVQFGTLEYLKADRFGFLMGVDDLFWRSLVWAARKPFVIRGYPRLWSFQMDDQVLDWAYRIPDLYNTDLTGQVTANGVGGPWKPTGFIMPDWMPSEERASVITDIQNSLLQISPHSFGHIDYGNLYWDGSNGGLTDAQWQANLSSVLAWKQQGTASTDQPIPSFSRSLVGHFWDLSDNIGYDAWHSLGFRYVTTIIRPGFQNPWFDPTFYGGAERLSPRPFWLYEKPPKVTQDEDYPFFFADDLVINSRAGLPSQTFYLFSTQYHDDNLFSRPDIAWPNAYGTNNFGVADSVDMFTRATWRFWSSLAPFQVYTHDGSNYADSSVQDRRQVIQQTSNWLNQNGVHHVFMEQMGDYIYARNKSMLNSITFDNSQLTYNFSGNTTTADGAPVNTQVLVFPDQQSEGAYVTIPAFTGGTTLTLPIIPSPPTISGITPGQGTSNGGTPFTISGSNFTVDGELNVSDVLVGSNPALAITVVDANTITATTPPGPTGGATVTVVSDTGSAVLENGFTYIGPPVVSSLSPSAGSEAGGTLVTITGQGFEAGSTVLFAGTAALSVSYVNSNRLDVVTPAGSAGFVNITLTNSVGSASYNNGFQYIASGSLLFSDDFTSGTASGWAISPLGRAAGWDVVNGIYSYDGSGHTQSYSGDSSWGDYTLDVKFRLANLNNYPGGIRGRVNSTTGASYAVWLYPASGQIVLWKATAWFIDNPGLTQLGQASGITFDTTAFHLLRMAFNGNQITVYYDGAPIITTTDSSYTNGLIALDVENQPIEFDDVVVTFGGAPAPPQLTGIVATPSSVSLSQRLETRQLQVSGQYSDGSTSDLTSNAATIYQTSNANIANVDAGGLITAFQDGFISVTVQNGTFTTTVPVTVQIAPIAPLITSVSPSFGATSGGTAVEIIGTGFTPLSTVSIGGAAASGVIVNNANSITAITPPGVEGPALVSVTTETGTNTLDGGFRFIASGSFAFADDFNDGNASGWNISPLGHATGWSVASGSYNYNGGGHTQSYTGDATWTDYTLDVKFKLTSLSNYPGGIRARVNPNTGASYAVWLYPANRSVILWKTTAWNIDSPGLTQLGTAGNVNFDNVSYHQLRMVVVGNQIEIFLDEALLISATDASFSNGLVALDVSNQPIQFDDVVVTLGQPVQPQLTSLSIAPSTITMTQLGQVQQLTVTGLFSDGSSQPLSNDPNTQYSSGNPNVVVTDTAGRLTAVANGNTSITVANGTVVAQVPVTVAIIPSQPQLTSLSIAPSTITMTQLGQVQQLTVTGLFSDGSSQPLSNDPNTQYSSGNPNVVVTDTAGRLTAVANGSTSITVANGTVVAQVPVTVAIIPIQPEILGVNPAFGPTGGGTNVEISGSGFTSGSVVTVGGVLAGNISVIDSNTIRIVTPAGLAGSSDILITTSFGQATLTNGFLYVATGTTSFSDDFSDGNASGWNISPLGHATGWSVASGSYLYNGGGHTQSYTGDASWQNYTLDVSIQLKSLKNYPGGIRGRINPATGEGYAVWLYPANGQIILWRVSAWNVDSPGLTQLAVASGINFTAGVQYNFRMSFSNDLIEVYVDNQLVISASDNTYGSGLIALDVSNQPISFDNISVTLAP